MEMFKDIVSTQSYTCYIKESDGEVKETYWENTNKLLTQIGFTGIKTG